MPKFERDAVRELITRGELKGVTFDTNVVESFARSGNLRHPLLKSLGALNDKGVSVVVSEVVAKEARKHFIKAMMDAHRDVRSALNKLVRVGGVTSAAVAAAEASLPSDVEQEQSLDGEFTAFLDMLKADVLKADDYVKFEHILNLYFAGKPPFANPNKKAEFPDAIAIASLEEWSAQEGALIAVSEDGDWISAFALSDTVHIVKDLRTALAIFQEDDKLAAAFGAALQGGDADAVQAIKSAIENSLDDLDMEVLFETDWQVDVELTEATLTSVAPNDLIETEIVGADAQSLTLTVPVTAKVHVVASASFSITDSIDGDDVGIGSHDVEVDVEHDYRVTITLYSHGDETIDVVESSIVPDTRMSYVDFEYVGFSPGPDYYEE